MMSQECGLGFELAVPRSESFILDTCGHVIDMLGRDYSTYVPSLDPYIVYSVPDPATLAKNITFGPRFIDLAASYPGTVVMGLNRGGDNLNNTIEAAVAVEKRMHNLQAIELGNEPDIYAALNFPLTSNSGYNLTTWTPETEALSESTWQLAVTSPLAQPNIIQAGNLEQPPSLYNVSNLIKYEDPLALETVKTFSHHNYPQSTYFADSVNLEALMKHQNIVENVGTFKADVEVARSVGWEYVLGETNSGNSLPSPFPLLPFSNQTLQSQAEAHPSSPPSSAPPSGS